MTGRDKFIVLALVALLALTSGAAIVAEQGRPATLPAPGGSYVEGVVGGTRHLNPLVAETAVDLDIARLVFTGLMRVDRNGEIVPDLASSVDVGEDGKVWTFEIRPDAKWHDGAPVIADDVVYTVSLLQDPAYGGPYAEPFRGVAVERVGTKVIRFTLPGAFGPFGASMTFPVLPSHRIGNVGFRDLGRDPFDQRPIGTGPFKIGTVEHGHEVTLLANLDFYRTRPERTRPYLDKVVLRSYAQASEALLALARGELDAVASVSSADAVRARQLRTVSIYSYPTNDLTALFFNVSPERPVFRERAVRQAIALAVDRGRILELAIDGRGRVADSFVPPGSWAYTREISRYQRSIDQAIAQLSGAGWTDTNGDGVREKGGVALRFTLASSDEPARRAAATQIVQDLALIGIHAEMRLYPFQELVDAVIRPRAYDAVLVEIASTLDPDPYSFFHSSQTKDPGFNFSGYSTLPMDRNLEAARRSADREVRRQLYAPVLQTIALEVPVLFLYFTDYLFAQHIVVQGSKIAPIDAPAQRFWDVEDWYVRTVPRR